MKVKVIPPVPLVNGRQPVLFVRRVSLHTTLLCAGWMLCVYAKIGKIMFKSYMHSKWSYFFSSIHLNFMHPGQALKKLLFFSAFSRQNTSEPIGKMRNKESGTLYPVSMALCVSQRPGPIIHSSFPYLSLHRMKDKQKPKSSWLAWCFCLKALFLSQPSLHPVPTSLQP